MSTKEQVSFSSRDLLDASFLMAHSKLAHRTIICQVELLVSFSQSHLYERWLRSVNGPRLRNQSAEGKQKKAGHHTLQTAPPRQRRERGQDVQPEVTDAAVWSPAAEPPSSSPFCSSLQLRRISLFSPDTCKTEGARRVWKPRAVWILRSLSFFPLGKSQCLRQLHSECYYHTHNDTSTFNSWVKKKKNHLTFETTTLRKDKSQLRSL